ncbi:MAG: PIN domain-containing protein [Syntrophaceae bacterium]|nr:PIN domain-containing protein [Syntrophaceae bacterium]
MKKYIIDANALISYVTDRNPDQQERIARVFQEAAKIRGIILCPQNVLTEFIYVLDKVYGVSKKDIRVMVEDFLAMPGVELAHPIDIPAVFNFWPEPLADFGDAIVASLGVLHKGSTILTFDRKFSRILRRLGLAVEKD